MLICGTRALRLEVSPRLTRAASLLVLYSRAPARGTQALPGGYVAGRFCLPPGGRCGASSASPAWLLWSRRGAQADVGVAQASPSGSPWGKKTKDLEEEG